MEFHIFTARYFPLSPTRNQAATLGNEIDLPEYLGRPLAVLASTGKPWFRTATIYSAHFVGPEQVVG
jgi:hypothetical protein